MQLMKVAQLAPYYYPSIGGVETVVQYISEELARRGHDVHVLTSHRGHRDADFSHLPRTALINGVTVRRHASLLNIGHMSFLPGVARVLIKEHFDVIHSHVYRHPHNEMAFWAGRLKSTPIILHGHSPFIARELLGSRQNWLYRVYDRYARHLFLRRINAVIALNEFEKSSFQKLGVESGRIAMIGNAAGESCFAPGRNGREFRGKYALQGKRILLFVGNLNQAKRPDLLVQALPGITGKFKDAMAVFVGPDEGMKGQIRAQAEALKVRDHCLWTGPLYGPDMMGAYQAADVFVLPSDTDMFPLVMVEAMAHGLPVVGSDAVGPSAIIEHGKTGLIFNRGAVQELVDAILSLLENPARLRQMGQNARSAACQRYRVAAAVDRVEAIYRRLTQEPSHRRPGMP